MAKTRIFVYAWPDITVRRPKSGGLIQVKIHRDVDSERQSATSALTVVEARELRNALDAAIGD